jgi:hypothetical protein
VSSALSKVRIITVVYGILAALCIGGELYKRLYDTGNSEFAGMLSMAVTLQSSIAIAWAVKCTSKMVEHA